MTVIMNDAEEIDLLGVNIAGLLARVRRICAKLIAKTVEGKAG